MFQNFNQIEGLIIIFRSFPPIVLTNLMLQKYVIIACQYCQYCTKLIKYQKLKRAEEIGEVFRLELGSRSLSVKFNSSSTQGSTHRVTWSLELVTIIAMPPTTTTTRKLFV